MTFSGWAATLAGWYVTEIGRQPWLVYGILTTAQAVTKVPGTLVASTLALYLLLYVVPADRRLRRGDLPSRAQGHAAGAADRKRHDAFERRRAGRDAGQTIRRRTCPT
jgi:hypothetical protein